MKSLKMRLFTFIAVLFTNFFLLHTIIKAKEPTWVIDKNTGCTVWLNLPSNESIEWVGECVNGKAHGNGTLVIHKNNIEFSKIYYTTKNGLTMVDGHGTARVDTSSYHFRIREEDMKRYKHWTIEGVVNKEINLSYRPVADYIMDKAGHFALKNCSMRNCSQRITILLYYEGDDNYAVRDNLQLTNNTNDLRWWGIDNVARNKRISEEEKAYDVKLEEKRRLEQEEEGRQQAILAEKKRLEEEKERREMVVRKAREVQEWTKKGKRPDEFPKERILSAVMFELENKLLHCGDSWYGLGGGSDDYRGTLLELKDISIEVKPYELSKADRANGIQWQGRVYIKSDLYRERVGKEWRGWGDGSGGVPIFKVGFAGWIAPWEPGIGLEIKNGEWHWPNYFSDAKKVNFTCNNIPK